MSRKQIEQTPRFVDRFVNGTWALLDRKFMTHVFIASTWREYDQKVAAWLRQR